jgi:hypothetical protein
MNGETRHRRHATLSQAAPDTRGARYARRVSGAPAPRFSDLAKVPDWLDEPSETRTRIAALAILLRHRAALNAELSGPRLAMIADAVGEELLDAACEAPLGGPGRAGPLPPPDRILAEGAKLIEAGLPLPFAAGFPLARDDATARQLTDQAHAIARALA